MMILNKTPAAPAAAAPDDAVVRDTDINHFMRDVVEASMKALVIVEFWSPRSPMCKQMVAILEKTVLALQGAVRLVKVNIDSEPEIAQQFRVQSVPTVYAMFQGQPVDGFQGAQTEAQVTQWLARVVKATGAANGLPNPLADIEPALQQAEQALTAGDWQTAQDIFADILGIMPENAVAYSGVARSMIAGGYIDQARALLSDAPESMAKDKALATARTALELADQAAAAGPAQELAAKLEANPADHQTRFDLALALLATHQREEAVEHLLTIVRQQRSWNEEAARKQLVKLFEAFGATDPLTISGRKRLSSLLFA